jgi:hypothetical protein
MDRSRAGLDHERARGVSGSQQAQIALGVKMEW